MIYTSIIPLTVPKIFSLNEWEQNFLVPDQLPVLLYCYPPAPCWTVDTIRSCHLSSHIISHSHIDGDNVFDHTRLSLVDPNNVPLTLIATIDLACSWKIAWRGGGTFTERSMVWWRMSGCSMVRLSSCHPPEQGNQPSLMSDQSEKRYVQAVVSLIRFMNNVQSSAGQRPGTEETEYLVLLLM